MKTIIEIRFNTSNIPGGADTILSLAQCGNDVAKKTEYEINSFFEKRMSSRVELTLDNNDERVAKVLALAATYGIEPLVDRHDVYTEDELQSAPLLVLRPWWNRQLGGGRLYGTTYDLSKACPRCASGVRQSSTMIVDSEGLRRIENARIAATYDEEILLHDVDVERLLAAGVTGASFWPVQAKTKGGKISELRRQQMFVEYVMPPMAPSSLLNRTKLCPMCHRSGFMHLSDQPLRYMYRREDLANIQDVNATWEQFSELSDLPEDLNKARWPEANVLITPKVMNLLRGKTKKEAKNQGCDFIPIWIEDEKP